MTATGSCASPHDDFAGAETMFCKALDIYPDHARSLIGLSAAHDQRGERAAAEGALAHAWRALDELRESGRAAEAAMATAFAHIVAGRRDEAIAGLTRLVTDAPPGFAGWTIPIEPLLADLKSEPAFRAILARLADRAS